jgi:hypothetical protein
MTKVLLVSEDTIKTYSGLNDNIFGKSLLPAIREAQEIGLQGIIGSCLYQSLCSKVEDGSIVEPENTAYKTLLDEQISYYMIYKVISDLIPIIGVKLGNIGVMVSNDEHLQNLSEDERSRVDTYYNYRADFYCKRMQQWLLDNKELFPELDECSCNQMKANLESAASTGLWLGGYRSPYQRIIKRKICC